jgi:hypothetical protein
MKQFFIGLWRWLTLQLLPAPVRVEMISLIKTASALAATGQLSTGSERREWVKSKLTQHEDTQIFLYVQQLLAEYGGDWILDVAIKTVVAYLKSREESGDV